MAYQSNRTALLSGDLTGGRLAPFWDRLVFSKVRDRLGGRLLHYVSIIRYAEIILASSINIGPRLVDLNMASYCQFSLGKLADQ